MRCARRCKPVDAAEDVLDVNALLLHFIFVFNAGTQRFKIFASAIWWPFPVAMRPLAGPVGTGSFLFRSFQYDLRPGSQSDDADEGVGGLVQGGFLLRHDLT